MKNLMMFNTTVQNAFENDNEIFVNFSQLLVDAARGEGETIYTIAGILNVPAEQVAHISKTHFNEIFASENVEVLAVAEEVLQLLNIQAA